MNLFLVKLTVPQMIYIAIGAVVLLAGIFCAIYFPIRNKNKNKTFKVDYYKKVYSIAFNEDFYLINKFAFKIEDNKLAVIDHILFGDKFIYLITSLYYEGNLSGGYDDKSLIFTNKEGKKSYTDNPFAKSELYVQRLAALTGLDMSILVGVVLVNDECHLNIYSDSEQFYLIQKRRLPLLVKAMEHKDIGKLNEEQLAKAVKAIDKLNRYKKKTK